MAGETRTILNRDGSAATNGNGTGCAWLPSVLEQLAAIRQFPPGWDSHGADAPVAEILNDAEQLLTRLSQETPGWSAPHVQPTRSGGVQFEWELSGRYFEIEVGGDGTNYFFQDESSGVEQSGKIQVGDVNELVSYLTKMHPSM